MVNFNEYDEFRLIALDQFVKQSLVALKNPPSESTSSRRVVAKETNDFTGSIKQCS